MNDSAWCPAIADASHVGGPRIGNQFLVKRVVRFPGANDNQGSAIDRPDGLVAIDTGYLHHTVGKRGHGTLEFGSYAKLDHSGSDLG